MELNAFGIGSILYGSVGNFCDPWQDPWDLDSMHTTIQERLALLVNLSIEEIQIGAEGGFIDFNQLAVNSSSVIKHEIRNISTLLVEAEVLGKTLVYSGRKYSIL